MPTPMVGEAGKAQQLIVGPHQLGDEIEFDNIHNLALACNHGFEEYLRHPRLFHEQVAEFQGRFTAWATYLGVFAPVSICLDARLAGNPEMKELFLSMLKVLRRNLNRGLRRHQELNNQNRIADPSTVSDGAIIGITGSVDRLDRLALIIRGSSKTDEIERVRRWSQNRRSDGFGEELLSMIKHKFSSENFIMAESLQVQLATSIAYRRDHLLYQAKHDIKLRSNRKEETSSQSDPTTLLDTTRRQALEEPPEQPSSQGSQPPQQSRAPAESPPYARGVSQRHQGLKSGDASVYSKNWHTASQYPKPPENEICNFCGKNQPREVLEDEFQWRVHINKDIRPYICVSQECGNLPPAFASRREWLSHMDSKHGMDWAQQIHRPWEWYCPLEDITTLSFPSEQELLEHMDKIHSRDLPHSEMLLLCSRSKLPKLLGADICPFCGQSPPSIFEGNEHIYRVSVPKSTTGNPRLKSWVRPVPMRSSLSVNRPTSVDHATGPDRHAYDHGKKDVIRAMISEHVADHLESIALGFLCWNDSHSTTKPAGTFQGVTTSRVQNTDFSSVADMTETEVAKTCLPQAKAPNPPSELHIQDIPYRGNTFPSEAINEDDLQLDELLREKDVQGEPSLFYPLKTVYQIFTRERVLAQLRAYKVLPNADYYVDLICAVGTETGSPPPYIKIFAILTLIGKGEAIGDFIDAELSDETLPFYRYDYLNAKRQHHLFLKGTDTPITALKKWLPHERSAFDTTQRMLLVPYLELGPGNMVQEYSLSDRDVLPWCKSKSSGPGFQNSSMFEGAYGKVYCVDIDRDCHAFHQVLQTIKISGDKFAVKELLQRDFNDETQFKKELDHLKRFNGLVHDHLVTLLASVTKGETTANKQYYFVFPFARYDLVDYWRSNHSPSWDKGTVKWVAKQLLGIMGAMDAIHEPKHLHLDSQVAKYGIHGDLKPDNILWFESHKDYRGILAISDFGLMNMYSETSRSNIPNEKIPAVPGYRPPECDIQNGFISRQYDIWTLGCLFLEMVTWLMGGEKLVRAFKKERMKTIYVTGAKRDMFYTVKKLEEQIPGAIHLRESIIAKPTEKEWYALEVKQEVKNWIQSLHEDVRCPGLIHDILDMIENEMLIVLSGDRTNSGMKERSSSSTLKAKLQEWVSKCERDDEYCFHGQPYSHRPVRASTVIGAPLDKEAEGCIEMQKPGLSSHNPLHHEIRAKSTVPWEEAITKEDIHKPSHDERRVKSTVPSKSWKTKGEGRFGKSRRSRRSLDYRSDFGSDLGSGLRSGFMSPVIGAAG